MNIFARVSKVFAVLLLVFLNFSSVDSQDRSIYRLPSGSKITVSMDSEISSKIAAVNDTFTATVSAPIRAGTAVVLPAGTVIEGRVIQVSKAQVGGGRGSMQVRFETMKFADRQIRRIDGVLVKELKADVSKTVALVSVLGGTAVGAIFGAASKIENGALLGAGIGAGAGTGIAVLRKGREVFIRTSEEFEIELKEEVSLPVGEY